jgi:hypothetical protein
MSKLAVRKFRAQVAAMLAVFLLGCGKEDAPAAPAVEHAAGSAPANGQVPAEQRQLFELAFRAASAIPLNPHVKTRSRLQEMVVLQALEAGLQGRAAAWCEQIAGWRRGTASAALALQCAKQGDHQGVQRWLDAATRVADGIANDPDEQAWRRDTIRAAIARVQLQLGDHEAAQKSADGLVHAEATAMMGTRAETMTRDEVAAFMGSLPPLFERVDFEECRAALAACAGLHNRFYYDADLRQQLAGTVATAYPKLPPVIRIELLCKLAEAAVSHVSGEAGIGHLDQAANILAASSLLPEQGIPLELRLASLRWRCGDHDGGRKAVAAAKASFTAQRAMIADIWRAGVLRSIAEALRTMGDKTASIATYAEAVSAGIENPNSRPRAEDLVATCLSMQKSGTAPDAALMQRLTSLVDGLGHPW